MRNKKAFSHLEFILSFLIFLTFSAILLIILNPFKIEKQDVSIGLIERAIRDRIEVNLTTVSFSNIVESSQGNCFWVERVVVGDVVVKNSDGIRIPASSAEGVVNVEDDGSEEFYKIYISKNFDENGRTSKCQHSLGGTLGVPVTRKIFSEEEIKDFNLTYYSTYSSLKNQLGIDNDFNLKIKASEDYIMEKQIPEGVTTRAKELPIQILNKEGEILPGKFNLVVW